MAMTVTFVLHDLLGTAPRLTGDQKPTLSTIPIQVGFGTNVVSCTLDAVEGLDIGKKLLFYLYCNQLCKP